MRSVCFLTIMCLCLLLGACESESEAVLPDNVIANKLKQTQWDFPDLDTSQPIGEVLVTEFAPADVTIPIGGKQVTINELIGRNEPLIRKCIGAFSNIEFGSEGFVTASIRYKGILHEIPAGWVSFYSDKNTLTIKPAWSKFATLNVIDTKTLSLLSLVLPEGIAFTVDIDSGTMNLFVPQSLLVQFLGFALLEDNNESGLSDIAKRMSEARQIIDRFTTCRIGFRMSLR